MDQAPPPPHERPWRHPSELGPPEHEPTTTAGRVLIVTTATLSLALIGLLVLTVTPDRELPSAGPSTTGGPTITFAALERPALPMVTPIGDDGWGVTTTGAITRRSGTLSARLPSGDVVEVEVVDTTSGLTVVSLPARERGYELAEAAPAPSDTVLVNGQPPRIVAMDELAGLEVDEGTPVLDEEGDLVGLCTDGDDGTALRPVATMPSTSVPTPPPTSAPPTSLPATTTAPPTAATTTTAAATTTTSTKAPSTTTLAPTTVAGPTASTVTGGASGAPG